MGPFLIILPLAVAALGLAAAAANKKKGAAGTAAGQAAAAAGAAAGPAPAGPTTAVASTPPPSAAQLPSDIVTMVTSAVNSGNPETMRRVAAALQGRYPDQAQFLNETADSLGPVLAQWNASTLAEAQQKEAAQIALQAAQSAAVQASAAGATPTQQVAAAQNAATQATTATVAAQGPLLPAATPAAAAPPPLTTPPPQAIAAAMAAPVQALQAAQVAGNAAIASGATPTQAILAAQNAAVMAASPAVNQVIAAAAAATPRPEPAPVPMPAVTAQPLANAAGKQLAADLAKALLTAKKGTASEPRALVQAFQTQERLSKTDGSYGAETALALADRYGIVPPKPFYWGKKGGPPNLPAQEKAAYSAHMLVLKSQDPQRADEWQAASKV